MGGQTPTSLPKPHAFDLSMLIAHGADTEQPMTLKELFSSLKYSERGIRYVLEQFIAGGWCEIAGHETDKRFRRVIATDQLRSKLIEYQQHVMTVYGSLLPTVP